jgi:hypothetical protein
VQKISIPTDITHPIPHLGNIPALLQEKKNGPFLDDHHGGTNSNTTTSPLVVIVMTITMTLRTLSCPLKTAFPYNRYSLYFFKRGHFQDGNDNDPIPQDTICVSLRPQDSQSHCQNVLAGSIPAESGRTHWNNDS